MSLRVTSEIIFRLLFKRRQALFNLTRICSHYYSISRLPCVVLNQPKILNVNRVDSPNIGVVCSSKHIGKRFKYKKYTKKDDSDDENEDESDDDNSGNLYTGYVNSLRVDAVLKAGLGMARNKVETSFYESRIRVNGNKIPKKSYKIGVGDEVDVIKGENMVNNTLLDVSRVVLVSAKESEDGDRIIIKMKRFKNLTVEEYPDPWKK